jgi:hypothetical protein
MPRTVQVAVSFVWLLVSGSAGTAREPEDKPVPLKGPVLIAFDAELDKIVVPRKQFGVFRNEDPKTVQWIEESWSKITVPDRKEPLGFLNLRYEVPQEFNGWWLRAEGADWSAYKQGSLVLRLCPGTDCTSVFKLELKSAASDEAHQVYVRLTDAHRKAAEQKGYADVIVSLEDFGLRDWSRMTELVLVFESNRIPEKQRKGTLLIHSIRLEAAKAREEEPVLKELSHKAFCWFKDNRNPKTGLVRDRAPNWKGRGHVSPVASVASVGYYLTMLPEAVRQGEITRKEAVEQAEQVLRFVTDHLAHEHGLVYHFVHWETGKRWEKCEISVVDSAILFNGCMVVAEAFGGRVADLANALVDRADWGKFVIDHPKTRKKVLALGRTPENGLLGPADVRSSELAMAYFLAVGSRTHPIDAQCWYNTAANYREVCGYKLLNGDHPLFTSYYGLGWHDLEGRRDRDGVDLYANARAAALANRAFCRKLTKEYSAYRDSEGSWWGISAGDSPTGYVASGLVAGDPDGTVWPTAALAALPWDPNGIREDLVRWRASKAWERASGVYGLAPFNLDQKWVGDDLIGIDLGSLYVNLANARNRTVWDLWKAHPVAVAALRKLEFTR